MDDVAARILRDYRRIAVVGISDRPDRDSNRVAAYLQGAGYTVIPVNPNIAHVLGGPCWPSLGEAPGPIEVVDVFRRSELVPPVVDAAIRVGARAVWMQDGVVHEAAAARARAAGLLVVMDRCMMRDHARGIGR
ncbi:MAG TPA: CoA-binding protein [Candidatus Eisenbacteria bacterium]|nr:CoA-binding protein [Candidatus Eisenbacteria bacterium]